MGVIRFIHTADWQLGKPFGRMPDEVRAALQEVRLDAIDAIGKLAADKSAKDVLVAGDVFDTFEPGERVVRQTLTRMGRANCRWWLLPGNHDYARAEGLWARLARDAPANVRALVVANLSPWGTTPSSCRPPYSIGGRQTIRRRRSRTWRLHLQFTGLAWRTGQSSPSQARRP